MWQFVALFLTITGSTLIYLGHRNQKLIPIVLKKPWQLVGYAILLLALVTWLELTTFYPAFFIWFLTTATILGLIPFLRLLKKREKSE